jgi:hypothetical protein
MWVWSVLKRSFVASAAVLADVNPVLAEKLQRASPYWMRHASRATISLYLYAPGSHQADQRGVVRP